MSTAPEHSSISPSASHALAESGEISAPEEGTQVVDVVEKPTAETAQAEAVKDAAEEAPKEISTQSGLTPLSQLASALPDIIKEAEYGEMWGINLKDESDVPTSIVLEKFLRANTKDVSKAKAQVTQALKWRKEMQPMKLLEETNFDAGKFGGLGYVTTYPGPVGHGKEIVTWNIYGAVKDNKATFGNIEDFIKWRSALMELSVKELALASAIEKIPENGPDPYQMVQVHDYLNVSFLRTDPVVKAASKEVIQTFSMAYPELLKEKFFVNVPVLMSWVFAAMKLFLSPATVKKFHPLAYGNTLASHIPGWGKELPTAYGGNGKDIMEGLTVKYANAGEPAVEK